MSKRVLILLLGILCISHPMQVFSQDLSWGDYEIINANSRWLWDIESTDLAEWQIFHNPRGIILSPFGDIVVSDTQNARLVRLSTDGDLIEIIGREGHGPGEFFGPQEMAFELDSSILWVVDHGAMRVAQFDVGSESTEYRNSFRVPFAPMPLPQNLVINDKHSFSMVTCNGRNRISSFNDEAEILSSFGEFYTPEKPTSPLRGHAEGFLVGLSDDRLAYVGRYNPIIELWTLSGNLISKVPIELPIIRERMRRKMNQSSLFRVYIEAATYSAESGSLYLYIIDYTQNMSFIFELSIDPLKPIRCFQFRTPTYPDISQFAVGNEGDTREFYVLGWRSGIRVIRAEK